MALIADNIKYPEGELQPSMFPSGDIDTNLYTWLTEATTKTSSEDAQRHWVYYRAYTAIAGRLAVTPSSQSSFGDVSKSINSGQISHFAKLADQHLSEFNRLTETESFTELRQAKFQVY